MESGNEGNEIYTGKQMTFVRTKEDFELYQTEV